FKVPFKKGMAPGEPGHNQPRLYGRVRTPTVTSSEVPSPKKRPLPPNRRTLKTYGILPGMYTRDELEGMGINTHELQLIAPRTAAYYAFNAPMSECTSLSQPPPTQVMLGPHAAYDALRELGCTLATQEWVDNHWGLILWKLAGMVAFAPDQEMEEDKRWSWGEVMRQLHSSYERELNGGSRPPLRLITTQDVSSAMPTVLCVSDIIWNEPTTGKDGVVELAHPELEVTDGWYRLRAKIDKPLARAVRKGMIRIGRKIGIVGANLTPKRPEPCEILEAYNKVKLSLIGNSTHLEPWHSKLGFMKRPPISTLSSLTADGGNVQLLDLEVTRVYPLAFMEFSMVDGKKEHDGPYDQTEERKREAEWEARRERVAEKIRFDLQKTHSTWKSWEDKLKRHAGGRFPGVDDTQPDHIDDHLIELLENGDIRSLVQRISPTDAGWLADALAMHRIKEQENLGDVITRELEKECPPRDVGSLRVLWMKDVRTDRKPSNRTAEVAVWHVTNLILDESGTRANFKIGQRFRITSLQPNKLQSWMPQDAEDGRVYLYTLKWTKWRKLP
ncbi:hypothetical protein K488DRAFT_46526, partial [Vararia minispora EC-137]